MELICPSCEARYQVPDASVGEKGRQVSCMNCGHSWHAFPPLILGSSAAPPTTASPGIDWQAPPRPGRSSAAFPHGEPAEAAGVQAVPLPPARAPEPSRAPEPAHSPESSRSEQLAEIREMLAEVQSEERAAAALVPDDDDRTRIAPVPGARPARPVPGPGDQGGTATLLAASTARRDPARLDDTDGDGGPDGTDPLRRRMAMHDRQGDPARADVERLRRRHDRRARRQTRARDAGTGAFLTGFLLVVMIVAAMTAIYVLHPQIVARLPGTGPMMTEYVATVDGARLGIAEGYEAARAWILNLLDKGA